MWRLILLKWDSFVLAAGSIIYGIQLFAQPSILQGYKVYHLIREMFDHRIIGVVFVLLGLLKLIGIALNNRAIKLIAMRGLLFVWLLFMVAFVITPPPNTVWIMALMAFSLGLGIVIREE